MRVPHHQADQYSSSVSTDMGIKLSSMLSNGLYGKQSSLERVYRNLPGRFRICYAGSGINPQASVAVSSVHVSDLSLLVGYGSVPRWREIKVSEVYIA